MEKGPVRAQEVFRSPGSVPVYLGFVVDKVALGKAFPECFLLYCQFPLHLLRDHKWSYHPMLHTFDTDIIK
jgi:hypothetical protein